MYFEECLVTQLASINGLNAKIFPITCPEGTLTPYLCYELNNTDMTQELTQYSGLVGRSYQLTLVHTSFNSLKTLKSSIISKLKTFQGSNIGIYIEQIDIQNDFEIYETGSMYYMGIVEFTVYHQE